MPPRPTTATSPKVFCAISASRSSGSRPPSSARSTPRSGYPAACSLRARPSDATCWCRANRRAGGPTNSHAASPMPSRSASSWPRFRSRQRARRNCSRSTTTRAIRSPARPPRRSWKSSSARVTAITSPDRAAAAKRSRTAFWAARSASSGSAATRCRPAMRASSAIRASTACGCRRRPRRASLISITSPTATPRSLVSSCVRSFRTSRKADDVVLAAFDYAKLDRDGQGVRIRLDSTCVDVRNAGDSVLIGYVRAGVPRRIEAKHAVLACFHMVIPHIMPELPPSQRNALARNVKTPLVYTNVLTRDWRAWARLGVHDISAPMSFHSRVKLDFPVSLGGYRHARDPSEPICLHLVHVPGAPNRGLDARAQFRIGQARLLDMTFADFEARIRDELDRMLGPGGFVSARDIAAITVNRWPHCYGYVANSLYDDDYDAVLERARQKCGRVAIANSDAGGDAYANLAIDQAARAVRELVG